MEKYASIAPAENEKVEWLALMQHYGAPTRLLDWTNSAYVALHFALNNRKSTEDCAVWAIDTEWVDEKSRLALVPMIASFLTIVPLFRSNNTLTIFC